MELLRGNSDSQMRLEMESEMDFEMDSEWV